MARTRVRYKHVSSLGDQQTRIKVTAYVPSTSTPVTGAWDSVSGGNAVTWPLASDSQGRVTFYLDTPQDVELVVTDETDFLLHPANDRPLITAGDDAGNDAAAKGTYRSLAATVATVVVAGASLAHRNDYQTNPENTMEGIAASIAGGARYLKIDVVRLADGTFGLCHNTVLDTLFGSMSGHNASEFHALAWKQLPLSLTTAYGPGIVQTITPPLLTEVLARFGGQAVFQIEAKDGGTAYNALIAEIQRLKAEKFTVITSNVTDMAWVPAATAAGIASAVYWNAVSPLSSPSVATVIAAAPTMVGCGYQYTDADITGLVTAAHAAGILVTTFSHNRKYEKARMQGLGVDIFQLNDSVYINSATPLYTRDRWSQGLPLPGEATASSSPVGQINPKVWLGSAGSYRRAFAQTSPGLLCGFLSPLPDLYTLTGSITWDTLDTDTTRFAWLALTMDDAPFNGDAKNTGYQFLFRQNGALAPFTQTAGATTDGIKASGTSNATTGAVGTTAITVAGSVVPFSLQRTATNYVFKRTDNNDTVTFAHGGNNYKYLHIGGKASTGSGLAVSYSGLVVT